MKTTQPTYWDECCEGSQDTMTIDGDVVEVCAECRRQLERNTDNAWCDECGGFSTSPETRGGSHATQWDPPEPGPTLCRDCWERCDRDAEGPDRDDIDR